MSEDLEVLRHLRIARDALRDLAGYSAYHDRASAALQVLDAEDHGSGCPGARQHAVSCSIGRQGCID